MKGPASMNEVDFAAFACPDLRVAIANLISMNAAPIPAKTEVCTDLINSFRCTCPIGFAGERCERVQKQ